MALHNVVTNQILANNGGTFRVRLTTTGVAVEAATDLHTGYMVSDDGTERIVSVTALDDFTIGTFLGEHFDALIHDGAFFGAWVTNGRVYLDISRNVKGFDAAVQLGLNNHQLAIWDVAKGEEITLESAPFEYVGLCESTHGTGSFVAGCIYDEGHSDSHYGFDGASWIAWV